MKLRIKNFQIIRNADLTFVPGLNVIRGPNSNGKSAIFRAVEAAVFNRTGDDFVTQGETNTAVAIDYNNSKVIWNRDLKNSTKTGYSVNGKVYTKVGRLPVPEVTSALGMDEVRLIDGKERLNFWSQMEKPFLIGKTESQLFEFISMSGEENTLMDALKKMRTDYQEYSMDLKYNTGSLDTLTQLISDTSERLKEYEGFDSFYTASINLSLEAQDVNEMATALGTYRKAIDVNTEAKIKQIKIDKAHASISTIYTLVDKMYQRLAQMEKAHTKATDLEEYLVRLSEVDADLDTQISNIDLTKLQILIDEHTQEESTVQSMISALTSVEVASKKVDSWKLQVQDYHKLLEMVDKELADYKTCPLCNSPLDSEHSH